MLLKKKSSKMLPRDGVLLTESLIATRRGGTIRMYDKLPGPL